MSASDETQQRIAAALERLAPMEASDIDWLRHPAYLWTGRGARAIERIEAPRLELLRGIERQKQVASENVARLAAGHAAHDMLLWGARGMGKSALVRAAVAAAQDGDARRIALVQTGTDALDTRFHACSQEEYRAIVHGYAEEYGLAWEEPEALEWARRRGARSGRVAWHFITELAGRAGKPLAR